MSSTFDLVPFHKAHIHLIDRSGTDCAWLSNPAQVFDAQARAGLAYTLLIDGRVAACGGITQLWPGLGEAWSVISPIAKHHPMPLTRLVKRQIDSVALALALHRVQCVCKTADQRATRWAECLGFVREGTLRAYGQDGSDHDIFARVGNGWDRKGTLRRR